MKNQLFELPEGRFPGQGNGVKGEELKRVNLQCSCAGHGVRSPNPQQGFWRQQGEAVRRRRPPLSQHKGTCSWGYVMKKGWMEEWKGSLSFFKQTWSVVTTARERQKERKKEPRSSPRNSTSRRAPVNYPGFWIIPQIWRLLMAQLCWHKNKSKEPVKPPGVY